MVTKQHIVEAVLNIGCLAKKMGKKCEYYENKTVSNIFQYENKGLEFSLNFPWKENAQHIFTTYYYYYKDEHEQSRRMKQNLYRPQHTSISDAKPYCCYCI